MKKNKLNFSEITSLTQGLTPIYCIYESNSPLAWHPSFKKTPKIFRDKVAFMAGIQESTGGVFYEHPDGVLVHFFDYVGFPKAHTQCTIAIISTEELKLVSENYSKDLKYEID